MAAPPAAKPISTAALARKQDSSAVAAATASVSGLDKAALGALAHGNGSLLGGRTPQNPTRVCRLRGATL
ncbi:hypothetical protein Atai01_16320 [Amycolatopsis taiwanensis]|uniref:Uncharacterized protein n=1 Tax=Amycolatopsis taiwanensis TaxID=342230 RepID=A0A9W6QWH5_9PSEU|nr:hypothetical protein Atai01_16320 [Amycolatopsis taiwanensis]